MSNAFDFVIPLFQVRWNTRAVMEGLTTHYQPRTIHIITPAAQAQLLRSIPSEQNWQTAPLIIHEEETFFAPKGLTKDEICAEIDLSESLYTPGWFYQQLLKLGAFEGIENLSEWYMVWDSDLLPVATWPLLNSEGKHSFALLQHNQWGNPQIVSTWANWIRQVLGVEPLTDAVGTFVPHHLWFKQEYLRSFTAKVQDYFQSEDSWLLLMMRSAMKFGTFSEYWSYTSWIAAQFPDDLAFYPYEQYGETTERFFDDGTGLFSDALQRYQAAKNFNPNDVLSPSYAEVEAFIRAEYGVDALPSSLAFESSPRHLKKNKENMHIEELRSRWNLRQTEAVES
ncbi:MAG: DUF6492 family protein [Jaaginema sp. PMC 1079.18]|nr:DUF6492 family protein [Jaaginema sp. PMC 1080.18]MEC4850186.1 DUF6492 family protein [Jaaginema sp. PMC 1079.18]MEC4865301.1 DUF6492 family protein [Jaaginema sp. PMC 1078.18]